MTVCLDSWAVLAWLSGEQPAFDAVVDALNGDERPLMSWINLGEVAYQSERGNGASASREIVARVQSAIALDAITGARVLEAAAIKAAHPIAYADCFAVATARAHDATLLTGDPELLDRDVGCRVRDLR